jgi:MFS family permease
MVSMVLYGLAVFAVPTIMAAAVADYPGISRVATAFATITIFFTVGQTIGPACAGLTAGASGTFSASYQLASLLTESAAMFAAVLPSLPAAEEK